MRDRHLIPDNWENSRPGLLFGLTEDSYCIWDARLCRPDRCLVSIVPPTTQREAKQMSGSHRPHGESGLEKAKTWSTGHRVLVLYEYGKSMIHNQATIRADDLETPNPQFPNDGEHELGPAPHTNQNWSVNHIPYPLTPYRRRYSKEHARGVGGSVP